MNAFTGTKIKTVFICNKVLLMNAGNRTIRQLEKNNLWSINRYKIIIEKWPVHRKKQLHSAFNGLHTAGCPKARLFTSNVVLMTSESLSSN